MKLVLLFTLSIAIIGTASQAQSLENQVLTSEDKLVNLTSTDGKFRFVYWYSNYCPPCIAVKTYFYKVEKQCKSSDLEIIRVNVNEKKNKAAVDRYRVDAMPSFSLINPHGEPQYFAKGLKTEEQLKAIIESGIQGACSNQTR